MKLRIGLLFVAIWLTKCAQVQTPIDSQATDETRNLLANLRDVSEKGFMFGHQDDQAYGVGWHETDGRSDVKETVGKYPAVHGWDLGKDLTSPMNIDSVDYDNMKRWIKDAYDRGGINSVSFHMNNLTTGSDSWDRTPSVQDILPGGKEHEVFNNQLDLLADFFIDCEGIPMVFRPWHEHNGNWFWWGKGNCTEEEYIQLFKYTVDYLKEEKSIHHLLYAFSPDRSRIPLDSTMEESYLYGYPGDDYVDIIGLDDYEDVGRNKKMSIDQQKQNVIQSLKLITSIAEEKNKVAALTETGLESVTNNQWFTEIILNPIKENRNDINIAWVLVWRNSNLKNHYYVPYPDHPAANDFRLFEKDEMTLFESDLNGNIYRQ